MSLRYVVVSSALDVSAFGGEKMRLEPETRARFDKLKLRYVCGERLSLDELRKMRLLLEAHGRALFDERLEVEADSVDLDDDEPSEAEAAAEDVRYLRSVRVELRRLKREGAAIARYASRARWERINADRRQMPPSRSLVARADQPRRARRIRSSRRTRSPTRPARPSDDDDLEIDPEAPGVVA